MSKRIGEDELTKPARQLRGKLITAKNGRDCGHRRLHHSKRELSWLCLENCGNKNHLLTNGDLRATDKLLMSAALSPIHKNKEPCSINN